MGPLSRQQIRQIDRYAIETLGVPGIVLMENAGRNATDAIEHFLGGAAGRRVAVVAGKGNNGGDGFVIARHLAMRGADVETFLLFDPSEAAGDAATNLAILQRLGHTLHEFAGRADELSGQWNRFDLLVDAIGGTGIQGSLHGLLARAVEAVNGATVPVVAIDIPTGLDADTGRADGPVVRADLTVTMLASKVGFHTATAAAFTGEVRVVDIGIAAEPVARQAGII